MDAGRSRSKGKTPKSSKPKEAPVRGKSAARATGAPDDVAVSPDERRQMIALAAYYRAEQRGFMNGDPVQDWLDAEAEITMRLRDAAAGKPRS